MAEAAGVTACVPLVALLPVQLPVAVHPVAFVDDQVSVLLPPGCIDVGAADSIAVGAVGGGIAVTVTVVEAAWDVPPAPAQARLYVEFACRFVRDSEPELALAPDQAPDAVHPVALVDDQVSVLAPPVWTEPGDADKVAVGTGGVVPWYCWIIVSSVSRCAVRSRT